MSKNNLVLLAAAAVLLLLAPPAPALESSPPHVGQQVMTGKQKSTKKEESAPAAAAAEIHKMFSGLALFYAAKFHGRRTASGATYDQNKLTCAHRSLPFGTKLLVSNPANGKYCIVTVNDRGPFYPKRVVDLSGAAAKVLGISGVSNIVCYAGTALDYPNSLKPAVTNGSVATIGSAAAPRR